MAMPQYIHMPTIDRKMGTIVMAAFPVATVHPYAHHM